MGDGRQKYIPTGSGAQCPRATIVVVVAVTIVAIAGSVGRAVGEGAVGGRESASEMVRVGSRWVPARQGRVAD